MSAPPRLEEKEWCHCAIHWQDFYVTKSLQLRLTCELVLINFLRVHHSVGSFFHTQLALATRSMALDVLSTGHLIKPTMAILTTRVLSLAKVRYVFTEITSNNSSLLHEPLCYYRTLIKSLSLSTCISCSNLSPLIIEVPLIVSRHISH